MALLRYRSRLFGTIRLVALLLAAEMLGSAAQAVVAGEYEIKAAFLFNLAKFVEWPKGAFESPTQPISVCVLGRNPFGPELDEITAGNTVAGRAFVSRQISEAREAENCHILFIGASESERIRSLSTQLNGAKVLTVGETEDFLSRGGMVSFIVRDGRIRFEIDSAAVGRAKLRASSKLLNLATNREK